MIVSPLLALVVASCGVVFASPQAGEENAPPASMVEDFGREMPFPGPLPPMAMPDSSMHMTGEGTPSQDLASNPSTTDDTNQSAAAASAAAIAAPAADSAVSATNAPSSPSPSPSPSAPVQETTQKTSNDLYIMQNSIPGYYGYDFLGSGQKQYIVRAQRLDNGSVRFTPNSITVRPGDKVTWLFDSFVGLHLVQAVSAGSCSKLANGFDTGSLHGYSSTTLTFTGVGSVGYYYEGWCNPLTSDGRGTIVIAA